MRKTFYALLALFTCASMYAQVIVLPVKSNTAIVPTNQPTFKWTKATSAALGYEFYLTSVATDTSSSAVPVFSTLDKSKRYITVAASSADTFSVTIDTALVKNTLYYWKVRAKTADGSSLWSKPGMFKVGAPAASITDGHNSMIKLNHDTLSAVTGIIFLKGSQKQILDTVYSTTNKVGLGATGTTRDTLYTWNEATAGTNVYTYKNIPKYGKTGSKILTITYDASGITVDDSLTVEKSLSAIVMTSGFKPAGDFANDYAILSKTAPAKTALTYPSTVATFGPDSITFSAFYDSRYNEYFGYKSASLVAVTNSQQTAYLKEAFTINNTSGATKGYKISFAVRKTRAEYFDAWAKTRAIFVTDLAASADTVKRAAKYVAWETFGAVPDTIQYSADGGTTFTNAMGFVKDTTAVDSISYRIPNGPYSTTNVVKIISSKGDVAVSSAFKASNRVLAVTNPHTGDSFKPDSQFVIWTNATPATVTKIDVSIDSGKTYSGAKTVSSTNATDTLQYLFNGKSTKCFVRATSADGDTGVSQMFTLQRYIAVLNPHTGDSFKPDSQYVVWNNYTGVPVTAVDVSVDSGKTYGGSIVVSSTLKLDTLNYLFNGKSTKCFVRVVTAAGDTGISELFTLQRYIAVTSPVGGASLTAGDSVKVVWNNYTGIAIKTINVSLDSGKTWTNSLSVNSLKKADSTMYLIEGTKASNSNVFLQVLSTAGADTGKSGRFSVGGGGAVFSMVASFGDPSSKVWVPLNFADGVAGDSLKAFDILVTYDSSIVKYDSTKFTSDFGGSKWFTNVDSTFGSGANKSTVRISAFKNTTGLGIKNSKLCDLRFTINNSQALIGQVANLTIKNSVLAAAGNNALSLNVSASTNGTIGIYSSVAGNFNYLHGKWDGSASYTISGDSLITYTDKAKASNNSVYDVSNGYFKMSSREPNDTIVITPQASKYMASGLSFVDVTDARAAWLDWHDTLQVRARIAADVNGDSLVNTTDAMAIMEISVDSTYLSNVGLSNWIFVDSTSLAGFESRSDSLTAWYTQQQHNITSKLVQQQTNQNFFGVLRGDVDFSYATAPIKTMKKSTAAPVVFSTDETIKARPGDEVWIPMNIKLNGENVGGFNSSMQLDPAVFTYTGEFKNGPSIPQGKNWYVTAKADAKGLLRVAGTDFSLNINPIVQDGPALLFKYVVNKETKRGVVSPISVNTQTVVDNKMAKIASAVKGGQVEISRMGATVVTEYQLSQNYPNPFNPSTTIEYALPMDSKVDIVIYNIIGQRVATLFSGVETTGYHQVDFNAAQMSSGIYFYTIKANSVAGDKNFSSVKKMMLLK